MAMNLHKGDNVNRLHSKVIDTIPYTFKHELLTIKTIKVMIVRKLEEVKNALLHDAILITTLQGYRFNRVYIDNEGGCRTTSPLFQRFFNLEILNNMVFI